MQLNVANADISSFINDICYNHFLPMFNKKHINFTFHSPTEEIKAYFYADKIDKIIFNLLANAFKFSPEKGNISIKLTPFSKDTHQYIAIKVSDSGAGINPEDMNNIFNRFYSNKTLKTNDSHGIGLSISKDLTELHHGKIFVESKLNEGSTFTVQIPIDKESYTTNEISYHSKIGIHLLEDKNCTSDINEPCFPDPVCIDKRSDINILLIDDNTDLLELMQKILSRTYTVLTASNGLDGLEMIKNSDIDIIISDVMMPGIDGLELCRTLKQNIETSHISIILLTAKSSIDDRVECYKSGADAYISKPFEMAILNARITNFISNKKSKQAEFKSNLEINISSLENQKLDDQFIKYAIEIIEKNLAESDFDIDMFAQELNLSRSSLYRKIKTLTGLAPIDFIRNIKLKHASFMLKNNTTSIAEVAYAIGFSDPKYFSSCFKAEFNITPSEFQKKNLKLN